MWWSVLTPLSSLGDFALWASDKCDWSVSLRFPPVTSRQVGEWGDNWCTDWDSSSKIHFILKYTVLTWSSGKLPYDCKKLPKLYFFFNYQNLTIFFLQKLSLFSKKKKNINGLKKKDVVFGNFLYLNGNFLEGQVVTHYCDWLIDWLAEYK